ncbi:MAG TPA: hypothetical protein VN515_01470 [Terriglobales bacterium]|nr:hypothetical protein [Terriglobales bacterium]
MKLTLGRVLAMLAVGALFPALSLLSAGVYLAFRLRRHYRRQLLEAQAEARLAQQALRAHVRG